MRESVDWNQVGLRFGDFILSVEYETNAKRHLIAVMLQIRGEKT